jgi:hypothetical protein
MTAAVNALGNALPPFHLWLTYRLNWGWEENRVENRRDIYHL